MCGEKAQQPGPGFGPWGSPPHVRGKDDEGRLKLRHVGITPAYAGKSPKGRKACAEAADHPRVCGEKYSTVSAQKVLSGSPPRMRGKVRSAATGDQTEGITPAYAGKRKRKTGLRRQTQDHPRVCGEKRLMVVMEYAAVGSPPRMRGQVHSCCGYHMANRITPAYAGKRSF